MPQKVHRSPSRLSTPAAAIPAAGGPPYTSSTPGKFKCQCCGKTKDLDEREPHLPPEWERCVGCHLSSERYNPHRDVTDPGAGGRRPWSVIDEWRRQNPELST